MYTTQIFISKLKLATVIGVYAEERLAPQTILLDVKLTINAVKSDHLSDTIDYDEVAKKLQEWASCQQFQLVESLAHYLADKLLATFETTKVWLQLSKFPKGLAAKSAGIIINLSSG